MTDNYIIQTYFPLISDLICFFVWCSLPGKLIPLKKDRRWLIPIFFLVLIIFAAICRSSSYLMSSPLRSIFITITVLIYIFLVYEESNVQKTIVFFLLCLLMIIADPLAVITFSLMNINLNNTTLNLPIHFFSGLLTAFYSYVLMFIISAIYNKIRHKKTANNLWQFEIILLSQFLFVFAIGYGPVNSVNNGFTISDMVLRSPVNTVILLLAIIITIIADVCLYRILQTNSQNYELKQALEIAVLKNNLEMQYFEKLRENYIETRKLNHDFSNLLIVLENLINNSDSQQNKNISTEIINDIKHTLSKTKPRYYCEHKLINLIVISKAEDFTKLEIDFSVNLNIPNNINIKSFDLCRLFTNILDNAKEASLFAKHKENTFIVLTASFSNNQLVITCENYCDSPIKVKGKKIISTKGNHQGLGLNIIKEIASIYDGKTDISYDDNVFCINVKLKTN